MKEKLRILRRLEAGEITAEEASRLLAELEKQKKNSFRKQKEEFEEKLSGFVTDLGNFLKNAVKFVEEKIAEVFPENKSE